MNINLFSFDNNITLSNEYISILEIENKKLFSSFIRSFYAVCNGTEAEQKILLFDGEDEISFEKNCEIVIDPLGIDFNSKKISTAITNRLKTICNDEVELWEKFIGTGDKLGKVVLEILSELEVDMTINTEWDVARMIKAFSITIPEVASYTHLERILSYIDIISEFNIFKIIIFCNLKSLLDYDEIMELYKYSLYKKMPLLLLESSLTSDILTYEKKLTIDIEFDEQIQ